MAPPPTDPPNSPKSSSSSTPATRDAESGPRGAIAVGAGILCSRVAGLLRTSVLGSVFGVGPHADVLSAAFRLPNLLQNLLGEQTLSASFIPIYARLVGEGRRVDASRFAGAVFSLLLAAAGAFALAGVLLARPIVALFAAGFLGDRERVAEGLATVDRFPLAVAAVQWIFPMTALLVLSAWALGILNSHGRFFLPYVAPVIWNAAIIGAVAWVAWGGAEGPVSSERLLRAACIGALVGGLLQFLIQLPGVMRELEAWSFRPRLKWEPVREAVGAFLPTFGARGIVQISSYVDQLLASLLAAGAVAALSYAQTLYLLPVSLFGLALAAAALPELSRRRGRGEPAELEAALRAALVQTSFLNLPTVVAYLLLGLPIVRGIFQLFGGRFGTEESWLVYLVLAGYSVGLPAATSSRVLQSSLYAGGDARSPARIAALRVAIALGLGIPLMLILDRVPVADLLAAAPAGAGIVAETGPGLRLGAAGLALAASAAAWFELHSLRRAAGRSLGKARWPRAEQRRFMLFAMLSAPVPLLLTASGWLSNLHPSITALVALSLFGLSYFALARQEAPARQIVARLGRRR